MSTRMEFEAKAVDKAVQKASEALHIPVDRLQYNVVSYGSSGIFGLVGVKKARISVNVPDNNAGSQNRESDPASSDNVMDLVNEAFGDSRKSSGASQDRRKNVGRNRDQRKQEPRRKPANMSGEEPPAAEADSPVFEEEGPPPFGRHPEPAVVFTEEMIETGRAALEKIITAVTEEAEISVEVKPDKICYNVTGGSSGVLIGKKGQTLEAIQYLVDKIVNKKSEQRIRIQVDVEGYLDNRKAGLRSLARKLADKTAATGRPASMGQMNAHDRRIVHLALKDIPGIRTQSIGDGFYRKLIIFPKKRTR
ncbi:MAG: RNA-binding protein [Desulfobacterales bacterium]|nr:MAG: RNA-binding protein [Desulfobacterales bacterium]